MIYGIGTDLCDLRRMTATMQRHGERFAKRVLGAQELQVWQARSARSAARGLRYVATRFSAKEAFSKAIGMGIRSPMRWRSCEILNGASGKPEVRLSGDLAQWFAVRGLQAHVSITDESDYVAAFVVVEYLAGHGAGLVSDLAPDAQPELQSDAQPEVQVQA